MSRLELDKIQSQLKVAIQNHQILVSKIKLNPQDMGFKKQLHNLQKEIMLMSEKQKIIVVKLRKEIMDRKSSLVTINTSTPPLNYQMNHGPMLFSPHSLSAACQPTDLSKTASPTYHPADLSQNSTLTCQPTDLSRKATPTCQPTVVLSKITPVSHSHRPDLTNQSPLQSRTVCMESGNMCSTPDSKTAPAVSSKTCSPLRIPQYLGNRPALLPIQGSNDVHHELTPRNGQIKPDISKSSPTKENCGGTESKDPPKLIDEKGDARELRKV